MPATVSRRFPGGEMAEWIKRSGFQVEGKSVFELGTGHLPIVPIGFFLCGAKSVYTVDLHRRMDIRLLKKVLAWFATNLPILSAWDTESIQNLVNYGIAELGIKGQKFYTPLRLALIHQQHGPELPSTFIILGKEESIKRLQQYLPS